MEFIKWILFDWTTARDLIGKKIGVNAVGAHFEIVLKEYLSQQGLSEEEIKK